MVIWRVGTGEEEVEKISVREGADSLTHLTKEKVSILPFQRGLCFLPLHGDPDMIYMTNWCSVTSLIEQMVIHLTWHIF